jgi:Putative Ig domain
VTINPIPAQTIAPGATLNVQVTARDPDQGATLVYSLGAGAPAGAAINPSSGLFTWTPSLAQAGDTGEIAVTVAVQGAPSVTDTTSLSFTVLSPPVVKSVSTTKLVKRRVNEGTSTINIVFSEAMAPLAGSSSFYSVDTPKKARVHGKITTKLVPVRFTARSTGANSVSLKLAKPSKLHLTLIVRAGDPAANGSSVGENVTFTVQ